MNLVCKECRFFHTPDLKAYVIIDMQDHQEVWPLKSKYFVHWLARQFHHQLGKSPSTQALKEAVAILEGIALFDYPTHTVHVRLARSGGAVHLDLANSRWDQVEITKEGWGVISSKESPIRFRRPPGMRPLPVPIEGGSLTDLRYFLNLENDQQWVLIVGWLIGAMQPEGPFPILNLQGGPGSGKSTITRLLRSLIDPGSIEPRTLPTTERDLAISAIASWLLAFDNVSSMSLRVSDALCRFPTGGGFATRKLYTDDSEILINLKRPCILNGIPDIVARHDLADRTIILDLPQIPDTKRRTDAELNQEWEQAKPGILGALCEAVSAALANLAETRPDRLPRMAGFARWVAAAEEALPWKDGTFMEEYMRHCDARNDIRLENDPVGATVLQFMEKRQEWSGTATKLLETFEMIAPKSRQKRNGWPQAPNALSNRLQQAAALLKDKGIEVNKGRSGDRSITIRRYSKEIVQAVQPRENQVQSDKERIQSDPPFVDAKWPKQPESVKSDTLALERVDDPDDLEKGPEEDGAQSSPAQIIEVKTEDVE